MSVDDGRLGITSLAMISLKRLLYLAPIAALSACLGADYEPMQFTSNGTEIVARGAIDAGTLDRFLDITERHPDARTLVLEMVEGSVDDEANLIFSREVRKRGFTTVVPSQGLIASGGTDLFLAGVTRQIAPGACVGVHSWGGDVEGRDVPRTDPVHQEYLSYYDVMGTPQAFYWFTLDAAGADEMHWMSTAEVARFGMTTAPAAGLASAAVCDAR